MLIKTCTYRRSVLSEEQKNYLLKAVPTGLLIQEWTQAKSDFIGIPSIVGIRASILIAEILHYSRFGLHPIAKESFKHKYSNNLTLLEAGEYWPGKIHHFEGKVYRAYKDWREFAVDYSDHLVFSRLYDKPLIEVNTENQIYYLSLTKSNPKDYNRDIINIINNLGLEEFDGQIIK